MVVKTNKKTKFDFLTLQKEDLRREIIFNYKNKSSWKWRSMNLKPINERSENHKNITLCCFKKN